MPASVARRYPVFDRVVVGAGDRGASGTPWPHRRAGGGANGASTCCAGRSGSMPGTARTRCRSAANRQLARHMAAIRRGWNSKICSTTTGILCRDARPAATSSAASYEATLTNPATSTGVTAGTARRSAARGRGALGGGRRSRTTRRLAETAVRVQFGSVQPGIQQDLPAPPCGTAAPDEVRAEGSHVGSQSARIVKAHGRPRPVDELLKHAGRSGLRCRSQTSKAREGSRPPWVQIPPLPPHTSTNAG